MQFLSISKQKKREWDDDCYRTSENVMFTQMSAKQGIKQFKERAMAVIVKEYKQLHEIDTFGRVCPEDLMSKHKLYTLRAITFIKEKRSGNIKGRAFADGISQRAYIKKEEASAPTVSMETLLVQLTIDAFEERAMVIFDVPGAYLNNYMPEYKFVLLKLEYEFVDIMCEVNPEFIKDVQKEGKKKVLYLRVLKVLYGCIESAFLWYNL